MNESIGVGIVSYNRPDMFRKCRAAIPPDLKVYASITGDPYDKDAYSETVTYEFRKSTCVGIGKNKLFEMMMKDGIDHIFIIEDDMLVKDPSVFGKYVMCARISGIMHMNYGFHGPMNTRQGKPYHRSVINYGDEVRIGLNKHCIGAFSYYDRRVIEKVGLIDEKFINCWDHVDHTYRICKACMTTPFWWFADIFESFRYIEDCDPTLNNSMIRHDETWRKNMVEGVNYFIEKHGSQPLGIPDPELPAIIPVLKKLKEATKGHNSP